MVPLSSSRRVFLGIPAGWQATLRKKSQANSGSYNAARFKKLPPPKPAATAPSSRQSAGTVKAVNYKLKAVEKPKTVTGELKKVGNKRKAEEDAERVEERPEVTKVPMLKTRIRNIPQEIVEAKWAPLSEKARMEVLEVVKAAERPVLMICGNERKRMEAQVVLQGVMKKFQTVLPKIPVPPMGKDMTLNYEKLIEKNRELESILVPDLRQIAELEAEIEREQKRLEHDEDYYEKLKKNAESQETIRRQKTRSMHPLLRNGIEIDSGLKDGIDDINLSSAKISTAVSSYDVSSDRQILPLTKALQQHLSSMQGNSGPLEEVAEWIQRSRAAVDEVIFQCAGEEVYDGIIGL